MSQTLIERIARSLSIEPRWAGNMKFGNEFYVSDHIIIGDLWLQRAMAPKHTCKIWFMHDASEAFIHDMITPEKKLMPDYQRREAELQHEIGKAFGISQMDFLNCAVKLCDNDMAAAENVTVNFEPCTDYAAPDSALVALIDHREWHDGRGRYEAFMGLYGELWDA